MAKATITIEDGDGDKLNIQVDFDPVAGQHFSHRAALYMLKALKQRLKPKESTMAVESVREDEG